MYESARLARSCDPAPEAHLEREQLILDHMPQIKYIAQRISTKLPSHVELNDLVSSGVLGLLDAIEKFDSSRGVKFKTYAELRIKGAILDSLRNLDWAPRSLRKKSKDLEKVYKELAPRRPRTRGSPPAAGRKRSCSKPGHAPTRSEAPSPLPLYK